MKKATHITQLSVIILVVTLVRPGNAEEGALARKQASEAVQQTLNKFCADCHNETKHKGDVRLDHFATLSFDEQFELLGHVEEQVYRREMPPTEQDKVPLPTEAERKSFIALLRQWDNTHQVKSAFSQKLLRYEYANYVDHERLFSGEYKDQKAFTYDRRWLVSEYIFNDRVNTVLNNYKRLTSDKTSPMVRGLSAGAGIKYVEPGSSAGNKIATTLGLANPFLLPHEKTGVLYYANQELSSDTFLTMLGNAEIMAKVMVKDLARENASYLPVVKEMTASSDKNSKMLAGRREFLKRYIDDICLDIYKDSNESLLPVYQKLEVPPAKEPPKGQKNRLRLEGTSNNNFFVFAYNKFYRDSKSLEEIVEKAQRFWFHYGYSEDVIQSRASQLAAKIPLMQSRASFKNSALVYKRPAAEEMDEITAKIKKHRTKGMHYDELISRCMSDWGNEFKQISRKENQISGEKADRLISDLYMKILERKPTAKEIQKKSDLFNIYLDDMEVEQAFIKLVQTVLLDTEFIYRFEYGSGNADQHGRKMLSPRDASYALAYALTETGPDKELRAAAEQGRLNTREDYKREVLRMLADRSHYTIIDPVVNANIQNVTNMPIRKLRFIRDFFGYPRMMTVFKDNKRFGGKFDEGQFRLIAEADQLVEYILEKDKRVFEELLATDKFYVYHNGNNESAQRVVDALKEFYEYFKKHDWKSMGKNDLDKHRDFLKKLNLPGVNSQSFNTTFLSKAMTDLEERFSQGNTYIGPYIEVLHTTGLQGKALSVAKFFNIEQETWDYSPQQPAPINNRKGLLTHPAWLAAHSHNTETDIVLRGKWIREKLLAGSIPDVPITVDAVIPPDKTKTLRQRTHEKTSDSYCWKCHTLMNPLGYAFENYDDFGRYRTGEELEYDEFALNKAEEMKRSSGGRLAFRLRYKTLPVDASGELDGTGDKTLDGKVANAIDLVERLAKSKRVRQSIIRNAFRFFMGRNEMLSDSKTLIDADEAYVKSGGSFDAVIVSLLTSDSFIYRKSATE